MKNSNLLDLNKIIGNEDIWAHNQKGKPEETLQEHSELCLTYYNKYCDFKGVDSIILNVIYACGCNDYEAEIVYNMFVNAIYLHDVGKINPYFQYRRLKNYRYKEYDIDGNSNHSLPSAYIYMCEYLESIDGPSKKKLSLFLFAFAYCIARHHGFLKTAEDFCDDVMQCDVKEYYGKTLNLKKNSIITVNKEYNKIKACIANEIAFNILCRLAFSLITACDYLSTSEYKNGTRIDISVINNIDELWSKYINSAIYKGIMEYKNDKNYFSDTPINALRSDIFLEAESELKNNLKGSIYYLEAPTGSGKTNVSINLMLNILLKNPELNNVFYIFPFNTLIEQTEDTLSQYFTKNTDMAVVNSITSIIMKNDENSGEPDYEYSYLGKIFNNYPIVITSHVNFFNALFGCGKEQIFPLTKLCNSVVIIDEIQSYKNSIWRHIITFLNEYSKLLNIKIIIMSATLPKLDKMLDIDKSNFISLIKDADKYYQNPLFKNRVEIDLSLLEYNKIDLNMLAEKVFTFSDKKVLIEFINKTAAREFYNILIDINKINKYKVKTNIVELTGDDNIRTRKKLIREIKKSKNIIVVATQVIEAGIDIDMDIGFKDISIPDAEEQFLGRINRSCKKVGCKAYFFNYSDAAIVYKGDLRLNYPITDYYISQMFKQKDFAGIYHKILNDLKDRTEQLNRNNIKNILIDCLKMKFNEVERTMRLIEPSIQLFIAYEINDDTGKSINGREIWKKFKQLSQNTSMEYAERKVNISRLAEEMSYFTYNVYNLDNLLLRCDEEFAGYYYIDQGERFIKDGKFDRDEFSMSMKGRFL